MEMMARKELMVRFQRLAGYLMQRGFVLLDLRPNPDMPHLNVFIFRDSPEIKEAIRDFGAEKNRTREIPDTDSVKSRHRLNRTRENPDRVIYKFK
jgi:hypothetical protein